MTRTPTPQLSHADRRAQLDALMANYTGPITHITAVKLSSSGARRLNRPRQSRVLEVRAARGRLSDKGPCRSRAQKEITTSPWLRHRLPEPFYSQNRVSPGHMIRVSGHSS